jgi:hypothetical protein
MTGEASRRLASDSTNRSDGSCHNSMLHTSLRMVDVLVIMMSQFHLMKDYDSGLLRAAMGGNIATIVL